MQRNSWSSWKKDLIFWQNIILRNVFLVSCVIFTHTSVFIWKHIHASYIESCKYTIVTHFYTSIFMLSQMSSGTIKTFSKNLIYFIIKEKIFSAFPRLAGLLSFQTGCVSCSQSQNTAEGCQLASKMPALQGLCTAKLTSVCMLYSPGGYKQTLVNQEFWLSGVL